MPDAPDDPELERLLDAYGQAEYDFGKASHAGLRTAFGRATDAHLDLLAYIERAYVRREIPAADTCDCPRCGAAHRSKDAADAAP